MSLGFPLVVLFPFYTQIRIKRGYDDMLSYFVNKIHHVYMYRESSIKHQKIYIQRYHCSVLKRKITLL